MSPAVEPRTALGRAGAVALNVLLPPRCLRCGCMVASPGTLCADCWERTDFLAPPCCDACGVPFEFETAAGALCAACLRRPPAFDRARAVFRYDESSRTLVLAFKHGDRTDAAPAFGEWLARAGAELLAECDLLVPVPLHWTRLFQRRYNQAALLAQAVARSSRLPVAPSLLVRCRRTPSQGGLSPAARRRNLRGAFAVPARAMAGIEDRRIVLIDDVLTTGATAGGCAKALLAAGARGVDVLTLARVVRPAP